MRDAATQQFNRARAALNSALVTAPVSKRLRGKGARLVWTGNLTPQVFTEHPRVLMPNPDEVSGVPKYSGAITTPTAWDGEQSGNAPDITKAV